VNPTLRVINKTGYDTGDLTRFFAKGLWALGCRKSKIIKVLPTRGDSRGIAYVGVCKNQQRGTCEAKSMVFMLPTPEKLTIRRLSRLFEHEVLHTLGKTHEQMSEEVYWSSQPTTPGWARGAIIRYRFGQRLQSPSLDEREGKRLDRELARLPERSPTRPRVHETHDDPLAAYLALRGEAPGIGPERGSTPTTGIARYVSPHGSVRYVLYERGQALAALQVVTRNGKHATIANVYTVPTRRKEGLARALLDRARRDFRTVEHASEEMISPSGQAWRARVGSPLRLVRRGHA